MVEEGEQLSELLNRVQDPGELKKLTVAELEELAQEIRAALVNTVSETGGHLAANLGVVELTLAMHYIFNLPADKIIWDVGHQSYAHKMLSGRWNDMAALRQYKGLSGFPKREESPYDAFNTGHSSTSISAAVGLALGRDMAAQSHSVLAVIGDGALTGGMAFEAMNHAGHLGLDVTVVLNDNEMSISKNVGALSTYLSRLRSDPAYSRRKEEVEQVLLRIPRIGENLLNFASKVKDGVKYLMVPGKFFEELGFTYIGPIDGHNIPVLLDVFSKVRQMKGPVLLHVVTQKGRGYQPALMKPDVFHGIGPFDVDTGIQLKNKGKGKPYTQVFGEYMKRAAEQDRRIVAITAAMTSGTGLTEYAHRFPSRFFDVGICEQHAVTMAAGLAVAGMKPVVAVYSTFLQRAFDQIAHDVCMQNLPVVFAVDRAGLVGEDGPTHHGTFDLSYLRQIPNMTVMAPADEEELVDMLDSALQYGEPAAIRYPRGNGEGKTVKDTPAFIERGTSKLLAEGDQVLLVGIGRGVNLALETARKLSDMGISAAIVNARFVKPLDTKMLTAWAKRCKRVVTIEDNALMGGFGSAVMESLAAANPELQFMPVGIPDRFIEHGDVATLMADLGMEPHAIMQAILEKWPELRIVRAAGVRK